MYGGWGEHRYFSNKNVKRIDFEMNKIMKEMLKMLNIVADKLSRGGVRCGRNQPDCHMIFIG